MFKFKNSKKKTNHEAFIIYDNQIKREEVFDYFDNVIELEDKMMPVDDAHKYINENGGITFVFNMNEPALVEANNIKKLRRSTAIQNLFDYDKEKTIDFVKIGLFAVIIVSLMF